MRLNWSSKEQGGGTICGGITLPGVGMHIAVLMVAPLYVFCESQHYIQTEQIVTCTPVITHVYTHYFCMHCQSVPCINL